MQGRSRAAAVPGRTKLQQFIRFAVFLEKQFGEAHGEMMKPRGEGEPSSQYAIADIPTEIGWCSGAPIGSRGDNSGEVRRIRAAGARSSARAMTAQLRR